MIDVTRFNGKSFVLNAELIEVMEETPDTVITLTTGLSYTVGNYYWVCHGRYRNYNKYD